MLLPAILRRLHGSPGAIFYVDQLDLSARQLVRAVWMKVQLAGGQVQVTNVAARIWMSWTPVEQGWCESRLLHVPIEAPNHVTTHVEKM